jgi:hypothetical protein
VGAITFSFGAGEPSDEIHVPIATIIKEQLEPIGLI